jgi:hypothetical protein
MRIIAEWTIRAFSRRRLPHKTGRDNRFSTAVGFPATLDALNLECAIGGRNTYPILRESIAGAVPPGFVGQAQA